MILDLDPPIHERVYYRHVENGQRAYAVTRAGLEKLRFDRGPHEEIIVPLDPKSWTVDKDVRPINATHLAEVAFAADRALCLRIALHREARKEWRDLNDRERLEWMKSGPGDDAHPMRIATWRAIRRSLEPYAG